MPIHQTDLREWDPSKAAALCRLLLCLCQVQLARSMHNLIQCFGDVPNNRVACRRHEVGVHVLDHFNRLQEAIRCTDLLIWWYAVFLVACTITSASPLILAPRSSSLFDSMSLLSNCVFGYSFFCPRSLGNMRARCLTSFSLLSLF